jgi:hypothetical protein
MWTAGGGAVLTASARELFWRREGRGTGCARDVERSVGARSWARWRESIFRRESAGDVFRELPTRSLHVARI